MDSVIDALLVASLSIAFALPLLADSQETAP